MINVLCCRQFLFPITSFSIRIGAAACVAAGVATLSAAPVDEIVAEFSTTSPFWVVQPGEEHDARFVLKNPTAAPVEARLQLSLTSYDGEAAHGELRFALPAGGTVERPLPAVLFGRTGIKYLDASLQVGATTRPLPPQQFAYMAPVGNAVSSRDPFHFSIAGIRPRDGEELDLQLAAAALVGAAVWRDPILWPDVEPQEGKWSWAKADRELELAQKHTLQRQVILTQTPRWALSDPYRDNPEVRRPPTYPGWIEAWRVYVRSVAQRYRGKIAYWEIWNEPDLRLFFRGSIEEYVALLKAGYEELKGVDPANVVLTGGFARAVPRPADSEERGDLQRLTIARAQGFFDVHAFHRHGMFPEFQRDVDGPLAEIRAQMREPKPLWFNETAMHSTLIGEREQARVLFKKLSFARARGAVGYTWFNLVERAHYPVGSAERHYGAMLANLQPKAVYVAYNEIVRRLQGKRFMRSLELGKGRWGFLFRDSRESVVMAWKEEASAGDDVWALKVPGSATAAEVDVMGAEEARPVVDGIALFAVTKEPRYWVIRGAGEPVLASRVLSSESTDTPAAGLQVTNPWSRPLSLTLDARSMEIPAHGTQTITATGSDVAYGITSSGVSGKLALAIPSLLRIPSGPFGQRGPDIVLDQPAQVTNVYEGDPSRVALLWKGPADASAKVWLALNHRRQLEVRIEVTDDVHQPAGQEHAEADRVRVVFQPADRRYARAFDFALPKSGDVRVSQNVGSTEKLQDVVVAASGQRAGAGAVYTATLDLAALGFTEADLFERGVGFNVMVQDADTALAESFIEWRPGAVANSAGGEILFAR